MRLLPRRAAPGVTAGTATRRSPLRVALLVHDADGPGSTPRVVSTLAEALARRDGVDVRLVSAVRTLDEPRYAPLPGVRVEHLADLRHAPEEHTRPSRLVPRHWDLRHSAHTDAALEAFLRGLETDVLVCATPALTALAVQLCDPSVRVVHQEHRNPSLRAGDLEPLLAHAPRVAALSVPTHSQADWLAARLGDTAPEIVVVPHGVPRTPQPPADPAARTFVAAAGRLSPEKQFGHLVDAFASVADRLPGWRLRLVGDGPARPALLTAVAASGYADRIDVPGALPHLRDEWAAAGVCMLASRAEALPPVLAEAMSAGVPVVAYDCPAGPREMVTHDVSGLLVTPQSVEGLAAALLRLGSDDALRARLGTGAREAAAAYDPDALAERWERILRRAVEGGRGPGPRRGFSRASGRVPAVTPQESRAEALRLVLAGAGPDAFVLPADDEPVVVVPATARGGLLEHLGRRAPDHLSLLDPGTAGWPQRRLTASRGAEVLAGAAPARLVVEPWPRHGGRRTHLVEGAGTAVEFWDVAADGALVAPLPNRWARSVPPGTPRGTLEVAGTSVPTLAWTSAPATTDVRFDVDVVCTWVDDADPQWEAARRRRRGADEPESASGAIRFRNHDELRWCLRSLHLFAPWVRRIHLVTAGQRPAWLAEHPRVRVVDHREILPEDALPTFNSHAIETGLHRIEGLAEHFVYFNDDVLLGRPATPSTFFNSGGATAAFLSPKALLGVPGAATFGYELAAGNNRRLLTEALGTTTGPMLGHTPHPHRVSVLREIEERFGDELAATARTPFRSGTDVSLLSNLAQHYGLATGTAYAAQARWTFVSLGAPGVEKRFERLLARRDMDFLCLGDHADNDPERTARVLPEFGDAYFPVPAPWEAAAPAPDRVR